MKEKEKLKIIPLGGMQEIGKNMTVFEFGNDLIIVDCGLSFPEDDMLGIDLVIPDVTYLEKNKDRIRGMVITHGHEDHIGAIPYILRQINIPIYATRLTIGLIETKLEEHKLLKSTKLKCVKAGDTVSLGRFKVEFIRTSHSIADAVALAIHTPLGVVVHTGDFKIDYTPIDGQIIDFARFAELGKKGVLALLSDSTNAERPGYTMSESSVGAVFNDIFDDCDKRIIVATFASNVHRVQQIFNCAMKHNRKVAVVGRSMQNVINVAMKLGYLNIDDNRLIDIDETVAYPDEQVVIITTGSQGESMSALSRMAVGDHRKVEITNNDLVVISASPIPGNEKALSRVIDELFKRGADVIYHSLADIHVSGHACQEELKLMISLVKPKYFIPVHGEYRHLQRHAEIAKKLGVNKKNIFTLTNGKVLEIDERTAKTAGYVPSGKVMVDGLGVGDVGNIVLRDRQHLSQDGLLVIVVTMDSSTGMVVAGPDVISRGFVYVKESETLMEDIKKLIKKQLDEFEDKGVKDWTTIKSGIKDKLRDYLYSTTKRNPMILPIIMEV
ncbi:MAG: ribonuclease J [Clostridiales bacterium]|nr:ribonuclease J [Clostridiales bacterium]